MDVTCMPPQQKKTPHQPQKKTLKRTVEKESMRWRLSIQKIPPPRCYVRLCVSDSHSQTTQGILGQTTDFFKKLKRIYELTGRVALTRGKAVCMTSRHHTHQPLREISSKKIAIEV
eukprot:scpid111351/ scgid1624/ 